MNVTELSTHVGHIEVLQLVTGDQIVARVQSVDGNYVTINKPRIFIPQPTRNGEMGAVCAPCGYPFYTSKDTIQIEASHIVMILLAPKQLIDDYAKHTSSIIS